VEHEPEQQPAPQSPRERSPEERMEAAHEAALVEDVARELGESNYYAVKSIRRLMRRQGEPFVRELAAKARAIEDAGGMFLEDLGRRRTLGGIFFFLCKQAVGLEQWAEISPFRWQKKLKAQAAQGDAPAPPPAAKPPPAPKAPAPPKPAPAPKLEPPSPEEARAAVRAAAAHLGEARTVKVTLIGRPGQVERCPTCVVTAMEHKKTPSLPKGLPALPTTPTRYAVFIANKHWDRIEAALAQNPDDELIVEGFAAFMPDLGGVGVFAANATTVLLQRAKKPAPTT
jgi:hypothetical protein